MRRVLALLLAVFVLFVYAFAADPEEPPVDSDDGEEVILPSLVADSGPVPVVVVDPEPELVAYAAGTVGPAGGYYLNVTSSALGACTVWLPYEVRDGSFSWYGGQLVSLRSGSVSGVVVSGSTVYNLRFSSFLGGAQYYRPSGSSYVWTALNISALDGGNIEVLDKSPGYSLDIPSLILVAVILIVGVRLIGYTN